MVGGARFRGEESSPCTSSLRLAGLLSAALAGCFNPTGSETVSTGADATASAAASTDPTVGTTDVTGGGATTAGATEPGTTGAFPILCGGEADCPPAAPICDPNTDTCVQCLQDEHCPEASPVCEVEQRTCRRCREHAECELACDLDRGSCFPPADTLVVRTDPGVACLPGCADTPACCSIQAALDDAKTSAFGHIVVEVGEGVDLTPVLVDGSFAGRAIALLGTPLASVLATPEHPLTINQIAVADPARLFVYGLAISGGATTKGVYCTTAPSLWFDASVITGHRAGQAVNAFACLVTMRRSVVTDNYGGPYIGAAAKLVLRNVIVGGNAPGPELIIGAKSALDAVYVTVVDDTMATPGALVACIDAAQLLFDNSLLLGLGGGVENLDCDGLTMVTRSAVSSGLFFPLDSTSVELDDPQSVPFVSWAPPPNYLLKGPDPRLAGVAVWQPDHPPTDIDGTSRPSGPDAADYPGADIPNNL